MLEGGGLECVCSSRQAGMRCSLSPGATPRDQRLGLANMPGSPSLLDPFTSAAARWHCFDLLQISCTTDAMQVLPIKKRSSQARASKQQQTYSEQQ
jgi:hypothetical protein